MHLWDGLCSAANAGANLHVWQNDRYEGTPWRDLLRRAERSTAGLRRAGVAPGDRVAALLTNQSDVVSGLLGVWMAGGVLASLPLRARGMDLEQHARQVGSICAQLQPTVLVADHAWLENAAPWLADVRTLSWGAFDDSGRIDPCPVGDDEVAFIQYSSGSTGDPKGCMLTPRAIATQLELIFEMMDGVVGREVGVSWLPLSHDMGLFGGLLMPMFHGFELFLASPERFALSPRSWLNDVARTGATVTVGTNTALAYGARACRRYAVDGSFGRLKALIVGAERVEWDTLVRLVEVLSPVGFRMEALMPAYGLAEATLAVTATPVDEAPRYSNVELGALADGRIEFAPEDCPTATKVVSTGRPCRGVRLSGLSDSQLQEVRVQSPSLTRGYFGDRARTEEKLRPEGLLTGDLGFERDGYLYVVGRTDDMISVAGRKVYAREVEAAVESIEGIREGTVTIVDRRGTGVARLALLVEGAKRTSAGDCLTIAEKAAAVALSKAAVRLDECIFLAKGSLPKTASGKIQRHRCLQLLEAGELKRTMSVEL